MNIQAQKTIKKTYNNQQVRRNINDNWGLSKIYNLTQYTI